MVILEKNCKQLQAVLGVVQQAIEEWGMHCKDAYEYPQGKTHAAWQGPVL